MKILDERGRLFGRASLIDVSAGAFFLLLVLSFLAYGYRIAGHRVLSIYRVTPTRIIAGTDKQLSITGSGFEETTYFVRLGVGPEVSGTVVNEAHLDAEVLPDTPPGEYSVYVRNNNGRVAVLNHAIWVRWVPQISEVQSEKVTTGEKLDLFGQYFESGCKVYLGDVQLMNVTHLNPNHLEIAFQQTGNFPIGKYPLTVVNVGGEKAVFDKGVKVVLSTERGKTAMKLNLRFNDLTQAEKETLGREFNLSTEMGKTAVKLDLRFNDLTQAEKETLGRDFNQEKSLVTVVLGCESKKYHDRHDFLYKGQRLVLDKKVEMEIEGRSRTGIVASRPIPQEGVLVTVVLGCEFYTNQGRREFYYKGQRLVLDNKVEIVIGGRSRTGFVASRPIPMLVKDCPNTFDRLVE